MHHLGCNNRHDNPGAMSLRALHDLPAPAKINLFLHVTGRREDGYHLLQSVFVLLDWCDRLHLERRNDAALRRHDLGLALPDDDLCLRAALALQQASGCTLGADIHVDKTLPWGAGLGGGSSDAATVLIGLNRLWGLNWTRDRLAALALSIGADVPFFIGGRNAFVEGIGERLWPLPENAFPAQWIAVVKPAEAIATAAIFGSAQLKRDSKTAIVIDFLADAQKLLQPSQTGAFYGQNDLQAPAETACSAVTQVARWLESRFGNSRMTGSGSAVFARAGTGDQPVATWSAEELPSGWVGRMCRSLTRHPLADWVDD